MSAICINCSCHYVAVQNGLEYSVIILCTCVLHEYVDLMDYMIIIKQAQVVYSRYTITMHSINKTGLLFATSWYIMSINYHFAALLSVQWCIVFLLDRWGLKSSRQMLSNKFDMWFNLLKVRNKINLLIVQLNWSQFNLLYDKDTSAEAIKLNSTVPQWHLFKNSVWLDVIEGIH